MCSPAFADQLTLRLDPGSSPSDIRDGSGIARFSTAEAQYPGRAGDPAIPCRVYKVLLPPDADMATVKTVILNSATEIAAEGLDVQPVPPPATWDGKRVITVWPEGEPIVDGRNTRIYASDALFPESPVKDVTSGQMRAWKIVEVPVALFQFNPAQKVLYRLKELELSIEYATESPEPATPLNFTDTVFEDQIREATVNYDSAAPAYHRAAGALPATDARYVIITTASIVSNSTQLANFVDSKEGQGFTVQVVTGATWGGGTGNTAAENIRSWLVANAASLNIEYVLLIGNPTPASGDVPMKMLWPRYNETWETGYRDAPSDYYYADLTGDWDLDNDGVYGEWGDDFGTGGVDRNWDVLVGRIPFYGNYTHLDGILAKLIAYTDEAPDQQAWRKKVLLPMEPSDGSTPGYHLGEAIKNSIVVPMGDWGYHRVYDDDYGLSPAPETVPCTVDNVTNAWNGSEFGAIFWWTHGSAQSAASVMDLSHAATLDDGYPGFTFQCSCLNAYPEDSSNLAYSLLRNGAVNTVGASRVSWYSPGQTSYAGSPSNAGMTYEYALRLISSGLSSAEALFGLKQTVYPNCAEWWMNWAVFNIYGDPSQKLLAACTDDADCDDGLFCNGEEACMSGVCAAGSPPCTDDTPVCDETNDRCVECLNNSDCSDSLFCTGVETCRTNECVGGTAPCGGDPDLPYCYEAGERCVECLQHAHCSPGYRCVGNVCAARGTLSIDKATVKAGKTRGTDSLQFSGSLNATEADLLAAVGGLATVTISAAYVPDPDETTFTFPVEAAFISKGKYKSPKVAAGPQLSLQIDTVKGTVKFSAKNADLTGVACPIGVEIQFDDYAAVTQLSEAVVNGTKPCPLPLMMGVMDSLDVLKMKATKGSTPGTDSISVSGTFTIDGAINPALPVIITLGPDTFTVPGALFEESGGQYGCKSADSGSGLVTAKFDTAKCTYSISIRNAALSGSGSVAFGINVFGNALTGETIALPPGF